MQNGEISSDRIDYHQELNSFHIFRPFSWTEETMQFHYAPLEEGHFRLLTVLDVEYGLNFELEDFALDKAPDYDAVSYAWEPKDADVVVTCNGKGRAMSSVVASMLRHLTCTGRRRRVGSFGLMLYVLIRVTMQRKRARYLV